MKEPIKKFYYCTKCNFMYWVTKKPVKCDECSCKRILRIQNFEKKEEFDDGTFQIDSGKEAEENYKDEINHGCKRRKFIELKGGIEDGF